MDSGNLSGTSWTSLSGYLEYKPGGGLGRLMFRRRLWFVLDDYNNSMLAYRSKEIAQSAQAASFSIDLRSAGIFLNPREKNQFILIVNEAEHQFTADNYESSMIWLLGLQSLRNRCSRVTSQPLALTTAVAASCFMNLHSSTNDQAEFIFESNPGPHSRTTATVGIVGGNSSKDTPIGVVHINKPHLSTFSQRYWFARRSQTTKLRDAFRKKGISLDTGLEYYQKQGKSFQSWSFDWKASEEQLDDAIHLENNSANSIECISAGGIRSSKTDAGIELRTLSLATEDSTSSREDELFFPFYNNNNNYHTYLHHSRLTRLESNDSALDQNCSHQELVSQMIELERQLIKSKCEMAKLLNKETCFKEMLEDRDRLIRKLDAKIDDLENNERRKASVADIIQSQIRELQDQTLFLSREIRHLARLRHYDHQQIQTERKQVNELKRNIETWKDNYVYLLQSCITIPTGDVMDGWQLKLYGGDTHQHRVKELLAEARQTNPSLPEYSWLLSKMCHVDQYGFRHVFDSEGLLLHYLCQQLHQHYRTLYPEHEASVRQWTEILSKPGSIPLNKSAELKALCRQGIPAQFRGEVWKRLINGRIAETREELGVHYYSHLVTKAHDSLLAGAYRKQIYMDLMRTMPNNINFQSPDAEGIRRMKEVLQAFSIHNPDVGYCQGLNFITAMFLLFLDTEDAFWALVAITERYFTPSYFDRALTGAQVDQEVLKELLCSKLPLLHQHFIDVDIELSTITLNWFLAIFYDIVPFQTLLCIWDCFLLEGPKVLFRFSLAIMQRNQATLLEQQDTICIMRYLKACTKLLFDAEGTVKTAFTEMKPFPKREVIEAKQDVQLIKLRERLKKRFVSRSLVASNQTFLDMELSSSPTALQYESSAVGSNDLVWLFLGCQKVAKISVFDCAEGLARQLDVKFDSQILCSCSANGIILVATLSRQLFAFCDITCKQLWWLPLNDTALSMCAHPTDQSINSTTFMVYAGLADGTLAVIEKVNSSKVPGDGPIYIPIGRAAVTCVAVVNGRLWAACGNTVHVLNATTLDTIEKIPVSWNMLDYVHTMIEGKLGLWLAIKGSSILELWDPKTFTCKMLYDVNMQQKHAQRKEEDAVNQRRITCLLPVNNSLWIGTGDGNLHIFDVCYKPHSTSPEHSSATANSSPVGTPATLIVKRRTYAGGLSRSRGRPEGVEPEGSPSAMTQPERRAALRRQGSSATRPSRRDKSAQSLTSPRETSVDLLDTHCSRGERCLRKISSKSSVDLPGEFLKSPSSTNQHSPLVLSNNQLSPALMPSNQPSPPPLFSKQLSPNLLPNNHQHSPQLLPSNPLLPSNQPSPMLPSNQLSLLVVPSNQHQPLAISSNSGQNEIPYASNKFSGQQPIAGAKEDVQPQQQPQQQELDQQTQQEQLQHQKQKEKLQLQYKREQQQSRCAALRKLEKQQSRSSSEPYEKLQDLNRLFTRSRDLDKSHDPDGSRDSSLRGALEQQQQQQHRPAINQHRPQQLSITPTIVKEPAISPGSLNFGLCRRVSQEAEILGTVGGSTGLSVPIHVSRSRLRVAGSSATLRDSVSPLEKSGRDYTMVLQTKVKISEKPVKCLVKTTIQGKEVVVSCAGYFGDDEPVLMWRKDDNQTNQWTNEPVLEICPLSNQPLRFSYMTSNKHMPRTPDLERAATEQNEYQLF